MIDREIVRAWMLKEGITEQNCDRLEQDAGVAVGDAGDHRAQIDPPGRRGREAERGVGLEHLVLGRPDHLDLEEVVHDPEAREPGVLGVARDPRERGTETVGRAGPGEVGDLKSKAHERQCGAIAV